MKNLIKKTFKTQEKNRPALVTYTVAGDPNKNQSLAILKKISEHVDIVEWGFPHNCPTADGKEIQNSSYRALENGIKLDDIFNLVKKYKKDKNAKPLILMGYYQMVFNYGEKRFVNKCKQVGVDGLIIVDLIWPYNKKFANLCKKISLFCSINSSNYNQSKNDEDNKRLTQYDLLYQYVKYDRWKIKSNSKKYNKKI